jgi:hypothetical protein
VAAEGEQAESDEGFGFLETESVAGQEPEFGVGGFDQGVG